MKAKSSLVLFAILLTSGCHVNARLYPVQGPLSAQTPLPVITAKSTNTNVSLVLGNGEVCKGRWTSATGEPTSSMSSVWDTVYGKGYYVAHILGYTYGQSVASCNRGTVLTIEIHDGVGVAKDGDGNIYKMTFNRQLLVIE